MPADGRFNIEELRMRRKRKSKMENVKGALDDKPVMENIQVTLGGSTLNLVPSLKAAKKINALYGGFVPVARAVEASEMFTITAVIAAGAGVEDKDKINAIEESVYAGGVASYVDPVSKYVASLMRGGRAE
jgi:hypothetical protein